MNNTEQNILKDEFGRITCPQCKNLYYWIKGDICSVCMRNKGMKTNKEIKEQELIDRGYQLAQKETAEKVEELNKFIQERTHNWSSEDLNGNGTVNQIIKFFPFEWEEIMKIFKEKNGN